MKLYVIIFITIAACVACGNHRQQQAEVEQLQETRAQFYEEKLKEVQSELFRTDSLLQLAEADPDTLNVQKRLRRDSLRHAADVQGARIRYLHRKQKEQ